MNKGMNLGYTGKPYDTVTGMYNYGYRDYAPETARFTTVDPVRDGANWFTYVNNDPVNWVDLWGLFSLNEVWTSVTAWQYEDRDAKNVITEIPQQIIETAKNGEGWRQETRDIFHQNDDEFREQKYTHPDGREVVIDGKSIADGNPQFVTDSTTRGTYNYVDPGTKPDNWYNIPGYIEYGARAVGHFFADVLPYAVLGNDRPNKTSEGCAN
jgi:RHS repeat-associated protein